MFLTQTVLSAHSTCISTFENHTFAQNIIGILSNISLPYPDSSSSSLQSTILRVASRLPSPLTFVCCSNNLGILHTTHSHHLHLLQIHAASSFSHPASTRAFESPTNYIGLRFHEEERRKHISNATKHGGASWYSGNVCHLLASLESVTTPKVIKKWDRSGSPSVRKMISEVD